MATELQGWWIDTYEQNVNHALQVKESVLEGTVTKKKCQGEKTRAQYIGTREMQERTEEDGDTRLTKNTYKTRWIYRKTYDDAFMLDEDDIERALTDPTSDNTRAGVFGANRCKDRMILRSLGAAVVEGKDADIVTPYDDVNQVIDVQTGSSGGVNTGLNLEKLYAIKEKFDGANLDPEDPRFVIVGTKQITNLLNTTEIKSADYNSVKVLCEGKVDTFLGFKFIRCNLLELASGNIRGCWAYTRNSIGYTLDGGLKINVGIAPTKNFQRITQLVMKGGGCRIYDEGVLKVPCQE